MANDTEKIAELNAIVAAVRERVRNGAGPGTEFGATAGDVFPPIRISPADLMPMVHARDAAQAKVAAIGAVNPRAGGLANKIIQTVKKTIARSLQWFVRDQVIFNREALAAVEAAMEALNEQNRSLVALAGQTNDRFEWIQGQIRDAREAADARAHEVGAAMRGELGEFGRELSSLARRTESELSMLRAEFSKMDAEAQELKDIRKHWNEWRVGWEQKLATNEIQFLRAAADLQSAFQHRVTLIETNFREIVKAQHSDYLGALDRTNLQIQKQFGGDVARVREEYERMIHSELRLIRMRAGGQAQASAATGIAIAQPVAAVTQALDYSRFAERFRGTEEEIRRNMEFYKPVFAKCDNVLDIGCGRGEFLEAMREAGVSARGIDLSAESVAQCREKGLTAEVADLFVYLPEQPDGEFDGIMSSQVVEHLPPDRLPEMIRLCAAKLRSGGILAIETPNPECLAIFATYFYLDPTHTRPMPHQYLQFCMEEAGLTRFEVHRLSPAIDTMPELGSLPADFRERFFGGLDYAIIGRKI